MSLLLALLGAAPPAADDPETRCLLVESPEAEPELDDYLLQLVESPVDDVISAIGILSELEDEIELADDFISQLVEDAAVDDPETRLLLHEDFYEEPDRDEIEQQQIIEDAAAAADDPETRMLAQFEEELEPQSDGFEDGPSAFAAEEEPEAAVVSEWIIRARRRGRR